MESLGVHEALKPLSWLIGKWVGENNIVEYPTMPSLKYCEEMEFVSTGQPLLNFTSRTWHAEKKNPMHFESGFLRIKPGTNEVAFMIAHNFGLIEIEEGRVEGNTLILHSKSINRMSFSKDPAVTQMQREYTLKDGILSMTVYMATTKTPLTKHLTATYHRAS